MNTFTFNLGSGRVHLTEGFIITFNILKKELVLGSSKLTLTALGEGIDTKTSVIHVLPPELMGKVFILADALFDKDEDVLIFAGLKIQVQLLDESLEPAISFITTVPQTAK